MITAGRIASPLPHGVDNGSNERSIRRVPGRRRPGRRGAFTLVELLVVIAIIAILAAILSVTVAGVINYIYRFTVGMEITELELALTQYNQEYGSYPPCIGTVPAGADMNANAFYSNQFSRHFLTSFRNNRENLTAIGTSSVPLINATDYSNFSSSFPEIQYAVLSNLDASETLPYFLGGAAQYWQSRGAGNLIGLKNDPVNPISGSAAGTAVTYYTFKPEQLVDLDGDGFPSYIPGAADGSTPFVYFNGASYRDQATPFDDRMPHLCWPPQFVAAGDPGSYQNWIDGNPPVPAPDLQGGYDPGIVRPYIEGRVSPGVFYNATGFQLLSAGLDNNYGADGFLDGAPDTLYPKDIDDPTDPTTYKFLAPTSGANPWLNMDPEDEDNVANFTEGSEFGDIGLE